MKRFHVTVNGTAYDVAVEEVASGSAPAPAPAASPTPAPAPVPAPVAAPEPAAVQGEGTEVVAPMPGTVLDVKVANGAAVKAGDPIVVLEAMKMENDIVAPVDGTVTSLLVKKGDTVESNDVMATIASL